MIALCMKFLRNMFSRNIIYYVLVVFLILVSLNVEEVALGRANTLQDAAAYPALYVNQEIAFDEKMFRLAEKYYKAFLGSVPVYADGDFLNGPVTLSRSYAMLAVCRAYLGFPEESAQYFKKALSLAPTEYWLNYNLGLNYFQRGEYRIAVEYFKNSLPLNLQSFEASIQMDYFQYWPPVLARQFQAQSLRALHDTIIKSYELSIVAYERMGDSEMAKNLAKMALRSGLGDGHQFFQFYASGGVGEGPNVDTTVYRYIVNPSVKFVPIGREKLFVMKNSGLLH